MAPVVGDAIVGFGDAGAGAWGWSTWHTDVTGSDVLPPPPPMYHLFLTWPFLPERPVVRSCT